MSLRDQILAAKTPAEIAKVIDDATVALQALLAGLSNAELTALDAASAANDTAGKAAILGAGGAVTFAGAITEQVQGLTSAGVGAKNGGTVAVVENGAGGVHISTLTLTGTPITLTDDPGNGAYVGLKLYDFPAGNIVALGASIDADVTLTEAWWTDAAEGDVGLGTVATAVGTALTGTTQNIVASTAVAALTAQVGPIDAQSSVVGVSGAAGGTDADLILNLRIDDAGGHFPDAVTNGAFGADTDWTKGAGWTIAAGVADCDGTQADVSDLSQDISAETGVSYSVTYTVTRSAGTVTPYLGGTAGTARSSANTFTETIVAGADGILLFRADADFVGTLDDVSAVPLTGTGEITGTVKVVWVNVGDIA